jgi:hypothetical protein
MPSISITIGGIGRTRTISGGDLANRLMPAMRYLASQEPEPLVVDCVVSNVIVNMGFPQTRPCTQDSLKPVLAPEAVGTSPNIRHSLIETSDSRLATGWM